MASSATSLIARMSALAAGGRRLGEDEEVELVRAAQRDIAASGESRRTGAMDVLVQSHYGWIIKMARSYLRRGDSEETVKDLVNEGVVGFMRAVELFDPARDRRLNAFAKRRVHGRMLDWLVDEDGPVRKVNNRAQRKIYSHLRIAGRSDPDDRIMTEAEARRQAQLLGVSTEDVRYVMNRMSGGDVSLDASFGGGDEGVRALSETLSDGAESIEDAVIEVDEREWRSSRLHDAIGRLPDRERRILSARHLEDPPVPLEVLSAEYGITPQRVHQIAASSLERTKRAIEEGMSSPNPPGGSPAATEGRGDPSGRERRHAARGPDMPRRATRR